MRSTIFGSLGLAILLCLNTFVMAQDVTGDMFGTVKDSNGSAVAGATVVITDTAKKVVVRTATTNSDGEFVASTLQSGTYSVTVEASNFKKTVQSSVKVDVGQRRSVEITLEAGRIDETVTVEADPVAVDLNSAASGTLINGEQVRELSLNNRNFLQLVTLAPGVTNDLDDLVFTGTNNPETNVVNRALISVNGGRPTSNTYTVDGADVTDRGSNLTIQSYPSVDSIREFKVMKQYSAESGQSAGGQVNVVTLGGGAAYHGSAYEFVRNEKFNANSFLVNANPNPPFGRESNGNAKRRPFRYNNFGFTVGGPIYFLKFGEKAPDEPYFGKWSKTFFFFSEEQRRDIRYPLLSGIVPSDTIENGVFPIDICLRGTVVGAVRTCLDTLPAGTNIATRVPLSNVARAYVSSIYKNIPGPSNAATYALDFAAKNQANFRQEIVRVDHNFSNNASAFYRYSRDKIPTLDADGSIGARSNQPFANTMQSDSPGRAHTGSLTWALKSNLLLDARATFGSGAIYTTTTGLLARNVSNIPAPLPYPVTRDVVPTLTIAGFSALQSFSNYDNSSSKRSFASNLAWLNGSHQFKFGGQYSNYKKVENALAGANQGSFSAFNNTPIGGTAGSVLATGVTDNNINAAVQSFANFLQGNNVTFTQSKLDITADLRQRNIEWYAQDDWKVNNRLSVQLGVRYSYFGAPWDANGHLTNFDPRLFSQAAAPRVTGAGNRIAEAGKNYCNGLIANSQNYQTGPAVYNCTPAISPYGKYIYDAPTKNFAPRIGLAFDPFGKGTTAVRMGYGVYYDQVSGNQALLVAGLNPPYQETCTITQTTLDQAVPGNNCTTVVFAATAASIRGYQVDWKNPYVQQWSLDVQHQLTGSSIVSLGYYGARGVHLNGHTEYNNIAPGVAARTQCASGATTLQDPNVATVLCQTPGTAFTATPAILDQIRPYRGYRSISIQETRYNSDYHSLQFSGQKRFSGASQFNVAYTWSKSLTDNPTSYITAAPQSNFDIGSERGRSPLDRKHVFTVNGIYEIPFYQTQQGFAGKFLGGWQASGVFSYQTGSPYTVTSASYDPGGIGFIPSIVAGGRPNLICDPNENAPHTIAQWFNTACFAPQTATGIANIAGTAGRGIIDGPPTKKFDMTLAKNFRFTESLRLQLRLEAFNVFNITNYRLAGTPNLSRTATTFGQITSFRDPRVLQLGLKFNF